MQRRNGEGPLVGARCCLDYSLAVRKVIYKIERLYKGMQDFLCEA